MSSYNDGHQVDKAFGQSNVGDVSAPDLVGSADLRASQQVAVNRVLRVCAAGLVDWCHALQAHGLYQALDALAVDRKAHQGADDDDHAHASGAGLRLRPIQPVRRLCGGSKAL